MQVGDKWNMITTNDPVLDDSVKQVGERLGGGERRLYNPLDMGYPPEGEQVLPNDTLLSGTSELLYLFLVMLLLIRRWFGYHYVFGLSVLRRNMAKG